MLIKINESVVRNIYLHVKCKLASLSKLIRNLFGQFCWIDIFEISVDGLV